MKFMDMTYIEPGHCYYGKCCEGEFVIKVEKMTITGHTGENPGCEISGDSVFVDGHVITDRFPSMVVSDLLVEEISAEDFESIRDRYKLSMERLVTMMHSLKKK